MDYERLADELMQVHSELLRDPANRRTGRMFRGECFVLNYLLTDAGRIHPKEISVKMDVSSARIAALLGRLEKKGYIARSLDPEDSRQVVVTLLEPGRREAERAKAEGQRCMAKMLERLGEEDAREYVRIQKKILRGFTACAGEADRAEPPKG